MLKYEGKFNKVVWNQLQFSSSVGIKLILLMYQSFLLRNVHSSA